MSHTRILCRAAAVLLGLLACPLYADAGAGRFPGKTWQKAATPEAAGWSTAKLAEAEAFGRTIGTAVVFIVQGGAVVREWGATETRFNVHSIRKSFLSALYGVAECAREIDLGDTLEHLGIDDNEPALTPLEKQATVLDLLKARSGVYHPALYETEPMKKRRPARHSHAPGTFWYYNNWDFNALGTIFRQRTGLTVYAALERSIARPVGMEDFRAADGQFVRGQDSIHPAYPFRMTARDMARFGLLMGRGGNWNGTQVVPAAWVARSTATYSAARSEEGDLRCGYGFLWWTELQGRCFEGVELPRGSFSARGSGGHCLVVAPAWDLVVVHRVDTDKKGGPRVSSHQFGKLLGLIVEAAPASMRASGRAAPSAGTTAAKTLPTALDDLVPGLMSRHHVPGVSIVGLAGGRVAWARQYGVKTAGRREPVTSETVFEAASMSKPVVAYAALKLVEDRKLNLDKPLEDYLDQPFLPDEPLGRKITARMVMSHTTGLPNWRKAGQPLRVTSEPGTKFTYSGEGFTMLQRVMEKITGRSLDEQMRLTLLEPLGMVSSAYVWRTDFKQTAAAGHNSRGEVNQDRRRYPKPNAAYSLYCTPAEYALFLAEMMRTDRSAAPSLSTDSRQAMLSHVSRIEGRTAIVRGGKAATEPGYWGLGWAIDGTAAGDRIRHSGSNGTGFRSYCEFDPRKGTGLVIMTNSASGDDLWRELLAVIGEP